MKTLTAFAAWTLSVCLGVYAWLLRRAALDAVELMARQGVVKVMLFYASLASIGLLIFLGLSRGWLRVLALAPVVIMVAVGWEVQQMWTSVFP